MPDERISHTRASFHGRVSRRGVLFGAGGGALALAGGGAIGLESLRSRSNGKAVHLNAHGSDRGATGSEKRPYGSFAVAVQELTPGDTLVIHGGVYGDRGQWVISDLRGTAERPITIASAPQERVVLDGGTRGGGERPQHAWELPTNGSTAALLQVLNSEFVSISGIVVQGSPASGIVVDASQHVSLDNCRISDCQESGIKVTGSDIYVTDCHGARLTMMNSDGHMKDGGWSSGFHTARIGDGNNASARIRFSNCSVTDCYGEAFNAFQVDDFTLENCSAFGHFRIGFYVDNARNGLVNRCCCIGRSGKKNGRSFAIGAEDYSSQHWKNRGSHAVTVTNSVFIDTDPACVMDLAANTFSNGLTIESNTFARSSWALGLEKGEATVRNNLFIASDIGYANGCLASGNAIWKCTSSWSNGTIFASAMNVNPAVRDMDGADTNAMRPGSHSPLRGRGIALTDVTTDYFGTERATPPTVGAIEASG